MSQVSIKTIGGRLVDLINEHEFAKPFDATFQLAPTVKLEDERLRVYVVPKSRTTDTADARNYDRIERTLDVVVQQRMTKPEVEADELLALSEEVEDFIRDHGRRTIVIDGVKLHLRRIETGYLYSPKLVLEANEFLSVASATFFSLES